MLYWGVVFGTLDSGEHVKRLKYSQWGFMLRSLPLMLYRPKLFWKLVKRRKSLEYTECEDYVVLSGARCENWMWDPNRKTSGAEVGLFKRYLKIMWCLGAERISCEVDDESVRVRRIHQNFGARVVRHYVTPDGRGRSVYEHSAPNPSGISKAS